MKPKTKKLIVLFASLALVLGFAAAELQKSVRVVVSTGTAKGMPDVAYDAQAERYLVVWQERSGSGDDRDIKARVVNRDGTPASDVVALASSGEDERLPKTAATGSSSWTVVWSTGSSIEACTVDATGKAEDFRTVTAASRPADRPDVSLSTSDRGMLVVWEELGEMGLTVIKGRRIHAASAGTDGEEFLLASSSDHDLRNPSVNQSGDSSFVAWEKPVEARRVDVEGRLVPADAASPLDLGEVLSIAADGAQNTVPSVTAFSGTEAFLVVWQSSDGRRDSDISFAGVTGLGVQTSGKLTDTADFREIRPCASGVGIAGRVLITYQIAPSNKPRLREIAARTIGWGDTAASAEMALDSTRAGGGNPASVAAAGADGRGLVAWDVADGEGTALYSKEWLASELSTDGLPLDIDGPIVPLADVTISGVVTFNGIAQADVLLSGFPIAVRTDATGTYSAYVPAPWSGTVTPVQPGFTFSPASNTYTDVNADVTGQNYTATYVGGAEDIYEDNDSFASAAVLPLGTTHDLILNDEEWFKILVPAEDAGKDLKIRIWGTAFPNTTTRRDLDFAILDASGRLLTYNTSGLHDETAYICDAVEGYYYVVQTYIPDPEGVVYSLTAELSDAFDLGYVTGRVTDDDGAPIEGATVELLGVTVDWWTVNNPLVITDADGNYKIGWYPGFYTIRFNGSDFGNDGLDWTPDANFLGEMYNWGEVVTLNPSVTLPFIDGALTPGGVISGTIRDSQGNPFTNARAYAYSSDTVMNRSTLTGATGEYTVNRLRAGNFVVRLRNPGGALTQEWYDGHANFASADPVGAGAEIPTSGVDALLEEGPWGTIAGTVRDADLNPVSGLTVAVVDPAGISLWSTNTDPSGHYAITRVPAGPWKVSFNAGSMGTTLVPQFYPGTRLIGDASTVQVVAGETTDGIDATLAAAGSISGQVLDNAGAVNIIAFDTASTFSRSVTVNPILPTLGPPTYSIGNLAPGTYKVLARPNMQGERMLHWYPDAASYADAGTVTVTAGAVTSGVDITLATGGALITGRVLDTGGYPIAGVVAVAQDASKQVSYASAPSNEEGYYTIRQVPVPTGTPGSVKIFFNTDANWLVYASEYYDNKADYSTANTVTVNEGATTTVPDVALEYREPLTMSTTSLPESELAVPYSQQLVATGGRTFYRWSIYSGALPPGLVLNSRGEISGTPTM
ncbi:MAG: cell surface receptor domain protein, partial [Candidatus Aminicenantes bacterium]|nr:cell surface receptor domain protein [Candidatus Aminicenantes bacterium]